MSRRNRSAAGHVVELRARAVVFAWVTLACTTLLACTTTLDPSILVGGGDGGGDAGGEPLAACTLLSSGGSEYLFCTGRLSDAAATADCARRSATLCAVGSAEENDFFGANTAALAAGDWWLGGFRDEMFVWRWPDGSVFWRGGPDGMPESGAFADWKAGEPNNASTTSPAPERCLVLTPQGDWNDRACELLLPYVCERSPQAP
jgi:hypothetical protein